MGQLLNHTIPNLAAGISQQFTESRFETQVSDMVNCMPSLARGIVRRNPLDNIGTLRDSLTQMTYLADSAGYFTYTYDRGTDDEQYLIVIGDNQYWYVYNINTGALIDLGLSTYLTVPVGMLPRDVFQCMTVGDYTFVVNKTIETSMGAERSHGYVSDLHKTKAFYWIKKTSAIIVSSASGDDGSGTTQVGNRLEGYDYSLGISPSAMATVSGIRDTRPDVTEIDQIDAFSIAEALQAAYPTVGGGDPTYHEGSFVYATNLTSAVNWYWEDSFGNEASLGVHGVIDRASKLPADLPSGMGDVLIKIEGYSGDSSDDYWLMYNQSSRSWEESLAPNIPTTLDETTMPHVFYRLSDGGFTFGDYREVSSDGLTLGDSLWRERTVGDETTAPDPSFIGSAITSMFFHKNRLGFISGDSVVLSSTNDYGNFFPTTVQTIPDDDPIDLTIATTTVTVLRHAITANSELIMFSDDAQFIISAGVNEVLTPTSANIREVSNYKYADSANAKVIGDRVYFVSESGGYSQIFKYQLTEGLRTTQATPLTSHIPSYIPVDLRMMAGHSVLGYTFFWGTDSKTDVYVLTNTSTGVEDVQNAFHKWSFNTNIVGIHIVKSSLFILFEDGVLSKVELEIPGDISTISYMDNGDEEFTSYITFSKYLIKDNNGNGTTRGRLQLRTLLYTITDSSSFATTITKDNLYSQVDTTTDWVLRDGSWVDTLEWVDTATWHDALPRYSRTYYDDKKVTVASNAEDTVITFTSNPLTPSSGFELATVNMEAFFHQRSKRY